MSRALLTQVAAAFRRTALPLASYYAVTLAVPLANGAARSGDAFVEHALVVLIVPPIGIVLASTVHLMVRAATKALYASVRDSPGRGIGGFCRSWMGRSANPDTSFYGWER